MRLLAAARDRNHYDISRDGQIAATLALHAGQPGRITLASGATLLLQRDSPLRDAYTIAAATDFAPADRLLRATRLSPLRRAYTVTLGGQAGGALTLRAASPWRGDYLLLQNGAAVGAIRQTERGRDATADLPDSLPADAAIALFCFILALWRRGNARVDSL